MFHPVSLSLCCTSGPLTRTALLVQSRQRMAVGQSPSPAGCIQWRYRGELLTLTPLCSSGALDRHAAASVLLATATVLIGVWSHGGNGG